jgi:sugar lactone lactonase YvrE
MKTILDGGLYYEGPRWHDGRLWFVDCMARTLLSVSPAGEARRHASFDDTPCGTGVLTDGRLLVLTMNRKRLFSFADGTLVPHADLTGVAAGTIDDMIVDGLGRAWIGDLGFDMPPPAGRGADGRILLVMPDGATRVAAAGLRFPNGIAVSADHRRLVVAEMDGACLADYALEGDGLRPSLRLERKLACPNAPDGICLDREGAVWVASYGEGVFVRIGRDGRELARIAVPGRRAIACVLGGPDRRTLFCLSAQTSPEEMRQRKSSSRIDVVEVDIPGAGVP